MIITFLIMYLLYNIFSMFKFFYYLCLVILWYLLFKLTTFVYIIYRNILYEFFFNKIFSNKISFVKWFFFFNEEHIPYILTVVYEIINILPNFKNKEDCLKFLLNEIDLTGESFFYRFDWFFIINQAFIYGFGFCLILITATNFYEKYFPFNKNSFYKFKNSNYDENSLELINWWFLLFLILFIFFIC